METRRRHRSFTIKSDKPLPKNMKITFDLGDESFTCRDFIQGAVMLDFVSAADEGGAAAAAKLLEFLKHAVVDADQSKLNELLYGDRVQVPMETIAEVVAFLVEEYTQRPTQELEQSDAGE